MIMVRNIYGFLAVVRPSANRIEFQSGQGRIFFFRLEKQWGWAQPVFGNSYDGL